MLKRRHNGTTQMGNGVICGPFSLQLHANNKMRAEREKNEQILSAAAERDIICLVRVLKRLPFSFSIPWRCAFSQEQCFSNKRESDVVRRRALHIFFGCNNAKSLFLSCSTPITETRVCNKNIKELPRMQPVFLRQAGRKRREMRMPTSAF